MGVPVEPLYQPDKSWREIKVSTSDPNVTVHAAPRPARPRLALIQVARPFDGRGWTAGSSTRKSQIRLASRPEIRAGGDLRGSTTPSYPRQSPRAILEGHRKGAMPDELTGGPRAEGVKALREFVVAGGTHHAERGSKFAVDSSASPCAT